MNDLFNYIRQGIHDPYKWWYLFECLGFGFVDGEGEDRWLTGSMPQSIYTDYIEAHAPDEFWAWCFSVCLAQCGSVRRSEWTLDPENNDWHSFLRRTDLQGLDLRGARLSRRNLGFLSLKSSDLRFADLSGAYCVGTHFFDCDLRGANLTDAHLNMACLEGAHLADPDLCMKDQAYPFTLHQAHTSRCNYNLKTKLPEDFYPDSYSMWNVDMTGWPSYTAHREQSPEEA